MDKQIIRKCSNKYDNVEFNFQTIYKSKYFPITPDDVKYGLTYYKRRCRKEFRRRMKRLHPDGNNLIHYNKGSKCRTIVQSYRRVQSLTVFPCTLENINRVLEIGKGYKTTVDWPEFFD